MATLANFLMTGQLGPIVLGITPMEAMSLLGDADDTSRKSNPLLLRYGPLQLTFVKQGKVSESRLTQLGLYFQPPAAEPLPEVVRPTDWLPERVPSERVFRAFLHEIRYLPVHMVEAEYRRHLVMPSGVRVTFSEELLFSILMAQREVAEAPPVELTDEREPSTDQIRAMLTEAEVVTRAGSVRAGLLMAWAAMEATLRRKALRAGLQGRVGVAPHALIRELQATRHLEPEDFRYLERVRTLRMTAAHGLAPVPITEEDVRTVIAKTRSFLDELGN